MSTYTWKTQYSENYQDEFQQKGIIEKDKAIDEFQIFPWDKEIDDYKRSSDNPSIPKIIFNSDDKRQLLIEAVSAKGYTIEYTNLATSKYSEFYISNDFNKNNYTVEELIDLFFDCDIEQHIKLKDISKESIVGEEIERKRKIPKNIEYHFNPKHLKTLGISTLLWLALSITLLVFNKILHKDIPLVFQIPFVFAWLPGIILHLTYYLKNQSAKVIIDTRNHELTYIKGAKEIKFNRDDIFRCQVTFADSSRASWNNYSYVWFILNDRTYISITCFIADPYEIVETLNCKYEEKTRGIPLLPI